MKAYISIWNMSWSPTLLFQTLMSSLGISISCTSVLSLWLHRKTQALPTQHHLPKLHPWTASEAAPSRMPRNTLEEWQAEWPWSAHTTVSQSMLYLVKRIWLQHQICPTGIWGTLTRRKLTRSWDGLGSLPLATLTTLHCSSPRPTSWLFSQFRGFCWTIWRTPKCKFFNSMFTSNSANSSETSKAFAPASAWSHPKRLRKLPCILIAGPLNSPGWP